MSSILHDIHDLNAASKDEAVSPTSTGSRDPPVRPAPAIPALTLPAWPADPVDPDDTDDMAPPSEPAPAPPSGSPPPVPSSLPPSVSGQQQPWSDAAWTENSKKVIFLIHIYKICGCIALNLQPTYRGINFKVYTPPPLMIFDYRGKQRKIGHQKASFLFLLELFTQKNYSSGGKMIFKINISLNLIHSIKRYNAYNIFKELIAVISDHRSELKIVFFCEIL